MFNLYTKNILTLFKLKAHLLAFIHILQSSSVDGVCF